MHTLSQSRPKSFEDKRFHHSLTIKNPKQMRKDSTKSEPWQFASHIPPITKWLCVSMVSICLVRRLNILPMPFGDFGWSLSLTFRKFQVWRLLTPFLVLPMQAMQACFALHTIYSHSQQLELVHFHNKPSDYLFYLCFNFTLTILMAQLFRINYPIFLNAFTGSLIYTWTIDNSNVKVMFYGLFPILGKYLSLVHLFVSFLFDGTPHDYSMFFITMIGFTAAYIYSCLDTRSLGPVYGFLAKRDYFYGKQNTGHFRAPAWFQSLTCPLFNDTSSSDQSRATNSPSSRIRLFHRTNFQGKGNRLGTKQE